MGEQSRSDTTTHLRERKKSKALPYSLAWLTDTETISPANAKKLISTSSQRKGSTLISPLIFFSLQVQLVQKPSLARLSTARGQARAASAGAEPSPRAGGTAGRHAVPMLLSLAKRSKLAATRQKYLLCSFNFCQGFCRIPKITAKRSSYSTTRKIGIHTSDLQSGSLPGALSP